MSDNKPLPIANVDPVLCRHVVLLSHNKLIDFFQDSNGHNIAGDEINAIFLH